MDGQYRLTFLRIEKDAILSLRGFFSPTSFTLSHPSKITGNMPDISIEIWREIGQYLPLTDKAAASRVNKAWNNIFRPHLYRSLSLRNGDNNRDDDKSLEGEKDEDEEEEEEDEDWAYRASLKVLMPPKEAVYKHEAFILDLKLNFPSPFLDGRTTWATRSLKRLRLDALKHKENPAALEVLDQLLTNSQVSTMLN